MTAPNPPLDVDALDELEAKIRPAPWRPGHANDAWEDDFMLSLRNAWPSVSAKLKELAEEIERLRRVGFVADDQDPYEPSTSAEARRAARAVACLFPAGGNFRKCAAELIDQEALRPLRTKLLSASEALERQADTWCRCAEYGEPGSCLRCVARSALLALKGED